MQERLQKILARANHGSRRSCESLIAAGRVTVNGREAKLGTKADINLDLIEVDGRQIKIHEPIYIKLNKPRGYISSTIDELDQGRPTIMDLVNLPEHLYPIGRLDKQSQGLMLLTNDGALTHQLTHPSFEHPKSYRAAVQGKISDRALDQWRKGLVLDEKLTAPAKIEVLNREKECTWLQITLREGRKRQIRRIAAQFGHPVQILIRESIGPINLGDLGIGKWRYLEDVEINLLRREMSSES
jgi:pseudouridine synthase